MQNLTALTLGETALSGTLPTQWSGLRNLSYFLAEATQLWGTVRPAPAVLSLPSLCLWLAQSSMRSAGLVLCSHICGSASLEPVGCLVLSVAKPASCESYSRSCSRYQCLCAKEQPSLPGGNAT